MSTVSQIFPKCPGRSRPTPTKCDQVLVSPKTGKSHYLCHFCTKKSSKIDQKSTHFGHFLTKSVRPTTFSGIFPHFRQLFFTPGNFSPFFVKKPCFFNKFSFSATDWGYKIYSPKLMLRTVKWPFFSCFFHISQLILCHFRKSIRRFSRVKIGHFGTPENPGNFPKFPRVSRRLQNVSKLMLRSIKRAKKSSKIDRKSTRKTPQKTPKFPGNFPTFFFTFFLGFFDTPSEKLNL